MTPSGPVKHTPFDQHVLEGGQTDLVVDAVLICDIPGRSVIESH